MLPVLGMGRPRARSHVSEGDSRDGCPWPVKHCAPMTAPDPDALVPLTACPDSQTAALLKAKLEGAGLHVVLQGEQHRAMLGTLGAYVEPRLLVKASQLEQARALVVEDSSGPVTETDPGAPDLTAHPDRDDEAWAARARRRRRWIALAVLLFPVVAALVPLTLEALRGRPGHVVDSAQLGYRVVFPGLEPSSSWGPPGPVRVHTDQGHDPQTGIEYAVSCVLPAADVEDDPAERFRRAKEVLERKLGPLEERTVGEGAQAPHELTSEDGRTVVRVVLAGQRTFFLLASGPRAHESRVTREFFDSFAARTPIDG